MTRKRINRVNGRGEVWCPSRGACSVSDMEQRCDRCAKQIEFEPACFPDDWWFVFPHWREWPTPHHADGMLVICPDCYRDEDNEDPSFAVREKHDDDSHIVDCSEGQGPNGRIMWEYAVIDGKDVVCR